MPSVLLAAVVVIFVACIGAPHRLEVTGQSLESLAVQQSSCLSL